MSDGSNQEYLIDRFLSGDLDDHGKEALALLLDNDPEMRRQFVDILRWESEIWSALNDETAVGTLTGDEIVRLASARKTTTNSKILSTAVVVAVTVGFFIAVGLYQILDRTDDIVPLQNDLQNQQVPSSVARVTGLKGDLIWTGDRGQIVRNIKVGTELAGGTIEGLAPDSWFELRFNDGSTIMISGSSLLTFGDDGQKVLRLREGHLSAKVSPQPNDRPMVISTRSAVLNVLGTQFNMEADLTSTDLTVNEGAVRFKRFSDGEEVVVEAQYQVTSDQDKRLLPVRVPSSVFTWKSELNGQVGNYGKWSPARMDSPAALKAIPLVPVENPEVTLYLAGISANRSGGPPVVVMPDSRFVIRGRLKEEARVYFGIRVKHPNGDHAGMFRGDLNMLQPLSKIDETGRFEAVYSLSQFIIDPVVLERQVENASSPDGLVLDGVWAFTHTMSPSGLEIFEVELLPPDKLEEEHGEIAN